MKAVYERPNVNFEMFAANQAISACTFETDKDGDWGLNLVFDCLRGGEADPANVIHDSFTSGTTACSNKIGFADYQGKWTTAANSEADYDYTKDNITQIMVQGNTSTSISGGHSNNNTELEWIETGSGHNKVTTGVTIETENPTNFMGWFYLSANSSKTEYSTNGWKIEGGVLKFLNSGSGFDGNWHAMLVPVFAPFSAVATSI